MFILQQNNDTHRQVTFSLDTNAYASGDLIADTQEITTVRRKQAVPVRLKAIHLLDKADQKVALHFIFLKANTSLGTENAAPTISDSNAENVVGRVTIAAADYTDLGGAAFASKEVDLPLDPAAGSNSLWVAIVNDTGTPTYGAADLIGRFVFE